MNSSTTSSSTTSSSSTFWIKHILILMAMIGWFLQINRDL